MDVTFLERMSWAVLVLLALLMLFTVRLIKAAVLQVVLLMMLLGVGITVWVYRDDLSECRTTCSCSLLGIEVDFSESAQRACDTLNRQ